MQYALELSSNNKGSTSGIEFSAIPTATTIPANETLALRLMGTPLETGSLVIRGCFIKITGFAEQEFLNEKQEVKKEEKPKQEKQMPRFRTE